MFLTCSWVAADLAAGIFHIYVGNMLRAEDGSVFVGYKQTKSPFFNYQGLIVCEVLFLVFGFCFICSAFVVDVQAMVYHFCSLQMVLVHIVKSIRWVIESSRNTGLFVVPKRDCPIFRVKGLDLTMQYVLVMYLYSDSRWRFFPLGFGSCSFASGAGSVSCLSASLCDFLCVAFCISPGSLREVQVVSLQNMGVSCKHFRYGILLHWHLESCTPESWSVFALVHILDFDARENVVG